MCSIILIINVTAACVRGCAASVGLPVTKEKEKERAKKDNRQKKYPVDGDTGNYKRDVWGIVKRSYISG